MSIRESIEAHRAAGYGTDEIWRLWHEGSLVPRDEHEAAINAERQRLLDQARPVRHISADDVFEAIPVRAVDAEQT